MVSGLLVANLVLAIVVLAIAASRARSSALRVTAPATLDALVAAAHSRRADVAVPALLRLRDHPDDAVPALPTAMALTQSPETLVSQAASILVQRVLSQRPDLLVLSSSAMAPLARRAVVASLPASPLAGVASDSGRAVVRDAARDADARVRREAARRLAWLTSDRLDVAAELAGDSDDETRRLACEHLAGHGAEQSVRVLVERLAASAPANVRVPLEAVARLARRFPHALDEMTTDAYDTPVRTAAILALGVTGREESSAILRAPLRDRASDVRRAAARALADLAVVAAPDRRRAIAVDLVRQFRVERSASVTLALLDAIAICRPEDGIAAIRARIDDVYPAIRARASEVLADLERATPA